ncbi:hypothetical protein D3C87_1623710 [compost metagenome]
MKFTAILLVTAFLQFAQASKAQRITLSQKNARLEQLFKEIRRQSGYDFFYDLEALKNARRVDLSVNNGTLEEVLKRCFEDQPFTFVIKDKAVIVRRKDRYSPAYALTTEQKIDIK